MKYNNQEIVYIEYHYNKPHSVVTGIFGKWSIEYYDFDEDCNDENSFMYYNSGSGGLVTKIQAPTLIEGCENKCSYWLHEKANFEGTPQNIKKINEPIEINGSKNPFENAREVFSTTFCKFCDKILDENMCEHIVKNEDGDLIYFNGEPID